MISVVHPTYAHKTPQTYRAKDRNQDFTNTNTTTFPQQASGNYYSTEVPLAFDDTSSFNSSQISTDSMTADPWGGYAQYRHPEQITRVPHQRESSLSSLGSTGPASPYSHNSANPRIAVNDATGDELSDMQAQSQAASFYPMAKPVGNSYSGYQTLDQTMPEMAYPVTVGSGNSRSHSNSRSYPASVTSSAAGDSPATPSANVGDNDVDRLRKGYGGNVPKLDRTMTDVYSDELYSPNFTITSTPPSQTQNLSTLSPPNDIFNQRLSAANSQHMSVGHSPVSSGSHEKMSPFRAGSPFAASSAAQDFMPGANGPMNTARRVREQAEAQRDAQMFRQHMAAGAEPETPKTISPKDAMLEFTDPDGTSDFPLFPPNPTEMDMEQLAKTIPQQIPPQAFLPSMGAAGNVDQFNYMPNQMQAGIQIPQQYPFVARPHPSSNPSPPRLSPSGHSSSRGSTPANLARPAGASADGGTYTCTYHGCTMRFETPAQLQKHKREGHRQAHGLTITRPAHDAGMAADYLNSQAGPHRCDRINPNTGKPCHTVFSRPYDLTRHEDTIHNARKQKVRCDLCTEEKTFSRADALTRHYRVCHPDMELPGKVRRRGGV